MTLPSNGSIKVTVAFFNLGEPSAKKNNSSTTLILRPPFASETARKLNGKFKEVSAPAMTTLPL